MKKKILFLLISTGLGFFSCKNEVDITGQYQDMPIVYCLLNPNDSAHYVRIQKAYLVDGNALTTAKVPDSLVYDPADLNVKVMAVNTVNGQTMSTLNFAYQPGAVTDTGLFAPNGVMIYKAEAELNDLFEYRLQITNLKLNKQITAKTKLVSGLVFKSPPPNNPSYKVNFNPTSGTGLTLRWLPANNGYVYQPEIVFHWTEVDLATNAQSPDSMVWRLTPREGAGQTGAEMEFPLPQNSFFRYMKDNVPVKSGIKRVIGNVTFRIYVGTSELNNYVNVNKPSIGLIQEKPVYTNVTNGLGIFSGRSTFTKAGVELADPCKDTLIFNVNTRDLNFKRN